MGYLLDTCLLSEVWKPSPNRGVMAWLGTSVEEELFLSVLSLGELEKGIEMLAPGRKRQGLVRDYGLLRNRFAPRVLGVTDMVAERWGEMAASATRSDRQVHVVDGLIAATALVFDHVVVTRSTGHFEMTPAPLLNPWT